MKRRVSIFWLKIAGVTVHLKTKTPLPVTGKGVFLLLT
jgi:hypothetical protein